MAEHGETDRGDGVGETEHDVLDRIAARQRLAGGDEEQGEQHHARPGTEVPAVDADSTNPADDARPGAMRGVRGQLVDQTTPRKDRDRGHRDQHRHDPLERIGRSDQQQERADSPAHHARDRQLPHSQSLPHQFGPRAEHRTGATEDERNRVGDIGGHWRQSDREQSRIAHERRKTGDAARQAATEAGQNEGDRPAHRHRRSLSGARR